jgi:serine/threonine protein kinase
MTLAAGSRLGPYEILSPIGAGGMGEVYRARDPRLGREVAIKVLPASFSQDADRLRRFEQEAKAAGLLNHPNITAVHDIGTNQSDGAPYVVQELLEGETLRAALAGGRLPQRKTIDYAIQIARGLAAAHDKGIVHRDLKPDNVFVTTDGRVKILDFGLAKLTHTEERGPATSLPTASAGTEPGVVMGTLGYMSPEQVRGKAADARSDLFALGAILYEMLSGKRAFQGDSAADTMSAILREDPPDLSVTNASVSPGLERVVRHCLEKSPDQRFHSAHDVAFALETMSSVSAPRLEPSKRRMPIRLSPGVLAAVVASLALGAFAGMWIGRPRAVSHPTFHRLTFRRGPVWNARFAADGNTIIYSASFDGAQKPELFSTRLDTPESLPLTVSNQWIQSISRSGEMLVLSPARYSTGFSVIGTLSQAPLSGSASRELLEDVGAADWSPDGTNIAVVHAPEWRYRLEYPVGKVLYPTTGWISYPRVSPKGDAVAFFDHPIFGDDRGSVAIVDLTGKKTTISENWESVQGLAWSPTGDEIWFTSSGAGMGRSLRAATRAGRVRDVLVLPGTLTLQDISRDGRVLLVETNQRLGFFGLFSGEAKERDLSGFEWSWGPRLSPDAKTILFSEQGEAGGPGYSVFVRKPDGSAPVRLGEGAGMAVSPDGKWILAGRVRTSPATLVLLPTGVGQPRTFPKDSIDRTLSFNAFLPDGKGIVYDGSEPGKPQRVFLQDLDGGAARPVTPEGTTADLVSPDGKLLLTRSTQGFALTPLSGGAPTPLKGFEAQDRPVGWTADGRSVYVGTNERALPARVFRVDLATGARELWKEFTPADPTGISRIGVSSISPDGKTMLFSYAHRLADLYVAEGLR